MPIETDSFWLEDGAARLYSTVFKPPETVGRSRGVVICNSIGHEYVHSYRSLRVLAERLANNGMYALRFDYEGTGNSSGDVQVDNLVDRWQGNIVAAATSLCRRYGIEELDLVAFRIGAYIARPVISDLGLSSSVMWAPPASVRQYLRELRALSLLADYEQLSHYQLESAGFIYTNNLVAGLKRLDSDVDLKPNEIPALILSSSVERPGLSSTFPRAEVVRQCADEYQGMMFEPHLTRIPAASIDTICDWLVRRRRLATSGRARPAPRNSREGSIAMSEWWQETIVSGRHDVPVGVFCEPTAGANTDIPVVVFPNAGSVHSMGPNRVYTQLARALAQKGIASFRFDLPNLGDSARAGVAQENHPYPEDAVAATGRALDFLCSEFRVRQFVLAGLCSGSYTAFRYALTVSDARISYLWMINPLTFHWEDGMPLRLGAGQMAIENAKYYGRAITDPRKWRHLFSGQAEYRAIARFLLQSARDSINKRARRTADALGLTAPTPLAERLSTITGKGIPVTFFFASRDLGYELLRDEALSGEVRMRRAGVLDYVFIDNADHTFTRSRERDAFVEAFVGHARKCLL